MSAKIDSEISYTIFYNGSVVNSSCDEMSFVSNDDHEICVKSSKFHDPDCAVELLIERGEDEKESKFNCQATETFCSKSKGSLSIQYILRNNFSPQNVSFSIVVFADEFDWDLLRTVLSIVIPLFLFLVTGIFLAFCFFCNRRRRTRAPYNTRPPVGSYPTQSSSYNNPPTGADSTLPPICPT
ncbi:uncharacterized protein LOC134240678 [Saccostrea cucullata]|uniref:uncharacterized protein LOC134240678 n=1 Tax=Saccostrea cuccullata TaxID=36930 RepID=UPI002ED52032